LIEAGTSVTPPGQMAAMTKTSSPTTYLCVQQSGHLIHDEAPQAYREAVESFLSVTGRRRARARSAAPPP
ncbi:MAG TPA: hypothetical protein VFI55_00155, partial [Mycobacterium sp.]|nr:hypothetical protein [Mycobacterium sp.]